MHKMFLFQYLQGRRDDWHVLYIANESGEVGKSTFVRNYEDLNYESTIVFDSASARDQFHMGREKTNVKVVIWYLTRLDGEAVDWRAVESIKDGRYNSTKYQNKRVIFESNPHCIIFSNKIPTDLSSLTYSRWRLGVITDKHSQIQWYKFDQSGNKIAIEGRLDIIKEVEEETDGD